MYDPRPQHLQCTSHNEIEQFRDTLQSFGTPCGFFDVISCATSSAVSLPLTPRSVRERVFVLSRSMEHLSQIHNLGKKFVHLITPSIEEADKIERGSLHVNAGMKRDIIESPLLNLEWCVKAGV